MYSNKNFESFQKECKNCMNSDICKWCDDFKAKRKIVDDAKGDMLLSPIHVSIDCSKFKYKNTPQIR